MRTPELEQKNALPDQDLRNHRPERRKAEQALFFSEARYRALFRDNPTMIFTLDTDWTILSVNPFGANQLGYAIDELEGQSVLKLFHEDDRATAAEQLLRCLKSPDQVHRWQFRKIRKDGGVLWLEETAQAVYDLNGAQNVMIVCQDVTERKRVEEERELLLLQLEAVLENIHEGVVISDLKGNVLTMNREALALCGYESVEQVRRHVSGYLDTFELSDLGGRPVPLEQWPLSRVLRGERFTNYEVRVRRKDTGKLFIFSYSGTPVQTKSGEFILSVVTLRDITERKRAEEELRKSEDKFSKIFQSGPVLICISTLAEGRFIDINEKGLQTLGYRREEIDGKSTLELGIWKSKSARDRMIHILEQDGMIRDLEISFRAKNGRTFIGLLSADFIDYNGERYILSIINDITVRKQMEEEIKRLNISMAERATELETANKDLEAFNYTVAHDLRQPLSLLNSYCQVIDTLFGGQLPEECKGYVRDAYNVTLRMNRLIDALLNFSRMGRVEPHRDRVDLSNLAYEIGMSLKRTEPERQVDFRIAGDIVVNGDANLLSVVLDNLLGNAWKYTTMREKAVIEFGARDIDGVPAYFVRDNGTGFDMTEVDKLFTPFQRLTGAEKHKGFGIGLATVERIIRRHGGKVWAEGMPDKGACIYFTLSAE